MKRFDAIFNKASINEADEPTADAGGNAGDPFSKGGAEDWSNISPNEGEESGAPVEDETQPPEEAVPTEENSTEQIKIESKEDVQLIISSVKALWKYGVSQDSMAVQKLIEVKDWQKFCSENGFIW